MENIDATNDASATNDANTNLIENAIDEILTKIQELLDCIRRFCETIDAENAAEDYLKYANIEQIKKDLREILNEVIETDTDPKDSYWISKYLRLRIFNEFHYDYDPGTRSCKVYLEHEYSPDELLIKLEREHNLITEYDYREAIARMRISIQEYFLTSIDF